MKNDFLCAAVNVSVIYYHPRTQDDGKVVFSVCHVHHGGDPPVLSCPKSTSGLGGGCYLHSRSGEYHPPPPRQDQDRIGLKSESESACLTKANKRTKMFPFN